MILVTGGCGFIGTRFVLDCILRRGEELINLDALTYAARPEALAPIASDGRYRFIHGDILDRALIDALLTTWRPRAIVHLAAETHVDRSIADATAFARTNTIGTLVLLQAVHAWLERLGPNAAADFRFVHCSTDEVFGALTDDAPPCDENAPIRPRNPYSASKAAAEHFVTAFHATHGLPAIITRATNTYGPGQHPEKLIALAIERLCAGEPVPLYGDGLAVRDWLYIDDHVAALQAAVAHGQPGHAYNIAGGQAMRNRDLIERLIGIFDQETAGAPDRACAPAAAPERIRHVADRPGHDRRYALDDNKLRTACGWAPRIGLEEGLRETVRTRLRERCEAAASRSSGAT